MIWLCWTVLYLTAPALKNPKHAVVFPTLRKVKQLLMSSGIQFAPGLLDVVQSKTPPTIAFFKSLPCHIYKLWAVYVLVLEKAGCRPRVYIGSGTDTKSGVSKRITEHKKGEKRPVYVQAAIDEGYKITHIGLICWAPYPSLATRVPLRAIFLVLETVFALLFWAMKSRTKDYYMPRICPWAIASLEYDGCCSHFSIFEQIPGADAFVNVQITPEEAEELEKAELERRREMTRAWSANRDMEKVVKQNNARIQDNLANKRYMCVVCNVNCRESTQLAKHLHSQKHKDKVGGVTKVVVSAYQQSYTAANLAARRFACDLCDKAFATGDKLKRHRGTQKHLNKVSKSTESIPTL